MAMLLGTRLALTFHWAPDWLATELRHGILAYSVCALLSAVAWVLVPQGMVSGINRDNKRGPALPSLERFCYDRFFLRRD